MLKKKRTDSTAVPPASPFTTLLRIGRKGKAPGWGLDLSGQDELRRTSLRLAIIQQGHTASSPMPRNIMLSEP